VGDGVALGAVVAPTEAVGDAATPGGPSVGRVTHEPIATAIKRTAAAVSICQAPKID
jgi:hypothetical protein